MIAVRIEGRLEKADCSGTHNRDLLCPGLGLVHEVWSRDHLVHQAVVAAGPHPLLVAYHTVLLPIAAVLFSVGTVLVLAAFYQLGITGTYLGDYFGILMDVRVTAFPFNTLEHPMYDGATMVFLAQSLYYSSPVGLMLTVWVFIVYRVSTSMFEGPFTGMINEKRAKEMLKRQKKG